MNSALRDHHYAALASPVYQRDQIRYTGVDMLEHHNAFPRYCAVVALTFDDKAIARFNGPAWAVLTCRQLTDADVARLDELSPHDTDALLGFAETILTPSVGHPDRREWIDFTPHEKLLLRAARDDEFCGANANALPRTIAKRWWGAEAGFVQP